MKSLVLTFGSLLLSLTLGCASSMDELSRAQQEIDTHRYDHAIERLERLAQTDSQILSSDMYVDLLTSAYLGKGGADMLSLLGHWAETYKSIEEARGDLPQHSGTPDSSDAPVKIGPVPIKLSFQEFKIFTKNLVPPEMAQFGYTYIEKSLNLCNSKMAQANQNGMVSRRLQIKSIFVNFVALLQELHSGLIPAVDRLISPKNHEDRCDGWSQMGTSFKKILELKQNIAFAYTHLGDTKNIGIKSASQIANLTGSLEWIKKLTSCEQITYDDIETIKNRFAIR